MRRSRGIILDSDHKSVEVPLFPNRRRLNAPPKKPNREMPIRVTSKVCSACLNEYAPPAFSRDASSDSGLQSECKACRRQWEVTGYLSRARALIESEPESLHLWQREPGGIEGALQRKWIASRGMCSYCESDLHEWQIGGHCLDRVSSKAGHTPRNVVLCCWPCNAIKGSMNPTVWKQFVAWAKSIFPNNNIAWDEFDSKRFKRATKLDLSKYLIREFAHHNPKLPGLAI